MDNLTNFLEADFTRGIGFSNWLSGRSGHWIRQYAAAPTDPAIYSPTEIDSSDPIATGGSKLNIETVTEMMCDLLNNTHDKISKGVFHSLRTSDGARFVSSMYATPSGTGINFPAGSAFNFATHPQQDLLDNGDSWDTYTNSNGLWEFLQGAFGGGDFHIGRPTRAHDILQTNSLLMRKRNGNKKFALLDKDPNAIAADIIVYPFIKRNRRGAYEMAEVVNITVYNLINYNANINREWQPIRPEWANPGITDGQNSIVIDKVDQLSDYEVWAHTGFTNRTQDLPASLSDIVTLAGRDGVILFEIDRPSITSFATTGRKSKISFSLASHPLETSDRWFNGGLNDTWSPRSNERFANPDGSAPLTLPSGYTNPGGSLDYPSSDMTGRSLQFTHPFGWDESEDIVTDNVFTFAGQQPWVMKRTLRDLLNEAMAARWWASDLRKGTIRLVDRYKVYTV